MTAAMPKHIFLSDWKNPTIKLVEGKGFYFYDIDGNEFIDASSGGYNVSLGYGREDLAEVIKQQAIKLSYLTRFTSVSPILEETSELLADAVKMDRFFLTSGGSEAVEMGTRIAKTYWLHRGKPNKNKILTRWMSFHGGTFLAMSYGGNVGKRSDMGSSVLDEGHIAPPFCYRCWFNKEPATCNLECADALETEIQCRGQENIAGFLCETIGGTTTSGMVPRQDYYKRIREICDKYEILLILDEILVGYGRTGKMLAADHFGIKGDIVTLAKCISGGYFPVGAVATTEAVAEPFKQYGRYYAGFTWAGNPMACAVIIKTAEIMKEEKLVENCAAMGDLLFSKVEKLKDTHPILGDVRGKGLLVGMEFVKSQETRESFEPKDRVIGVVLQKAMGNGVIVSACSPPDKGVRGDVILLAPYYGITREEVDLLVERLDKTLTEVEDIYL